MSRGSTDGLPGVSRGCPHAGCPWVLGVSRWSPWGFPGVPRASPDGLPGVSPEGPKGSQQCHGGATGVSRWSPRGVPGVPGGAPGCHWGVPVSSGGAPRV